MVKCPICGRDIKDDSKFCSLCGSKIPCCPTCGKVIYRPVSFCPNDGTKLTEDILSLFSSNIENPVGQDKPAAENISKAKKRKIPIFLFVIAAVFGVFFLAGAGIIGYKIIKNRFLDGTSKKDEASVHDFFKLGTGKEAADDWIEYQGNGYTISLSNDWTEADIPRAEHGFVYQGDKKKNINVMIQDLTAYHLDLEGYKALSLNQSKQYGLAVEEINPMKVDGMDGYYMVTTKEDDDHVYYLQQYFTVIDQAAFLFTFTTDEDGYHKLGDEVSDIFAGITFTGHAPDPESEQDTDISVKTEKQSEMDALANAKKQSEAGKQEETGKQSETGKQEETDMSVQTQTDVEVTDKEEILQKFGIDTSAKEDYGAVLNPDAYQYYDSKISDFSFAYPAELYHDVIYNEEPVKEEYGTNVESIHFTASKGSELIFTISKRTDNLSMQQITDHIYEKEFASMADSVKLIQSAEADHGRVIVTGYTADKSKLIYDMVKTEPDYVLHMKLIFPQYTGEEDKMQKGYITECVYRLCGFSGSSDGPRSYQDYKKGQQQ